MPENPKIGLLIPTRDRLNLQLTLINSIITSVSDINNVRLYFGVDKDDPTRETILKIVDAIPFVKIVNIEPAGKATNINKIWNILAKQSEEPIFGYIGDDMIFKTKDWDKIVLDELETKLPKDQLKLVYGYDGHRNGDLCVNAFIHRKYYELVGYLTREDFIMNWSDTWLYEIFTGINRIKYRSDLYIEHNHFIFGGRKADSTSHGLLQREREYRPELLWDKLKPQRLAEIELLKKYINEQNNIV